MLFGLAFMLILIPCFCHAGDWQKYILMQLRFIFAFLTIGFLINGPVFASAEGNSLLKLGPDARISLLTCSPGDDLYSIFGHSAVRVKDPSQDIDWVFNYGTFDFSDPNFYPNFVRGKLNYKLSVSEYRYFEYSYYMENRWIWEQELNLRPGERQYLFDSLVINYRPENRYYLYDFFFDNCATRIRDIFVEALGRESIFDYSGLDQGQSFRELLMPYLAQKPWARLGINLGLGLPADRLATAWDYMFLPDHMMTVFGDAMLRDGGNRENFISSGTTLLEGGEDGKGGFMITPLMVFLLVLAAAVAVSYRNPSAKRTALWFDRILFGSAGLLGFLIAFLWFATDHQVTVWNLNIIWAHPFHLVAVFLLSSGKYARFLKYYFAVNLIILAILFLAWPLIPQALPLAIIPLVISLMLRSALLAKKFGLFPAWVANFARS
jgi:hypothetical protein